MKKHIFVGSLILVLIFLIPLAMTVYMEFWISGVPDVDVKSAHLSYVIPVCRLKPRSLNLSTIIASLDLRYVEDECWHGVLKIYVCIPSQNTFIRKVDGFIKVYCLNTKLLRYVEGIYCSSNSSAIKILLPLKDAVVNNTITIDDIVMELEERGWVLHERFIAPYYWSFTVHCMNGSSIWSIEKCCFVETHRHLFITLCGSPLTVLALLKSFGVDVSNLCPKPSNHVDKLLIFAGTSIYLNVTNVAPLQDWFDLYVYNLLSLYPLHIVLACIGLYVIYRGWRR